MKQSMKKNQINSLNIIVSVELIVFGLLFLLVGLKAIPIPLSVFWVPVLLAFLGIVLLSIAIMRKDIFAAWFSVPFLIAMIIVFTAEGADVSYSVIYPLFIAMPGIASLAVLPFTKIKSPHIKSAIFFIGISLVFLLDVFAHIHWGIIIAIIMIIVGALLLINALLYKGNDWEKKSTIDKKE